MKKVLFFILSFIVVTLQPSAQHLTDSLSQQPQPESQLTYLQRAKEQRTLATVLLTAGVTLGTIGLVMTVSEMEDMFSRTRHHDGGGAALITIMGGILTVTSIPFYISAAENKRRAKLMMGNSTTVIAPKFHLQQTSIGLSISLGR